jgi:hypothetical protein
MTDASILKIEDIPDFASINALRNKLWSGRDFGQVSIMVGAGFSRNADPIAQDIQPFPDWYTLADKMIEDLYPKSKYTPEQIDYLKRDYGGISGIMRLAEEYVIAHGRSALDNFIKQSIPDEKYSPGALHKSLLSLPWSDVFTTNYDTLLERTKVEDYSYSLVLSISDISVAVKPRIVKLHGTLPSTRPFIITEEDYRTYPKKFSPFVNLVQQSIMENNLVLIGFSGNDPNFLAWAGWVRDNLGTAAPNLYLCGVLDLTPSKRRLFESMKVNIIDLAPLVPNDLSHQKSRHYEAIKVLLDFLHSGNKDFGWDLEGGGFSPRNENIREILEDVKIWTKQRQHYPGWIICPFSKRRELWNRTKAWITPIIRSIDEIEHPVILYSIYELWWRLDKSLLPLTKEIFEVIEKAISSYNPFPEIIDIKNSSYTPISKPDWDWNKIHEIWIELVFILLQDARYQFEEKRFNDIRTSLEKVCQTNEVWRHKLQYEKVLFNYNTLNIKGFESNLLAWPQSEGAQFSMIKKAALLAEFGEIREAQNIVESIITTIRENKTRSKNNYRSDSEEAWGLILMRFIKTALSPITIGTEEERKIFKRRWDILKRTDNDPWLEFELQKSLIDSSELAKYKYKPLLKRYGFDPNTESTTISWKESEPLFWVSYKYLRLFEEGAVPYYCASVNYSKEDTAQAICSIGPFYHKWAICALIRLSGEKYLDWLNRVRTLVMPQDDITHLFDIMMRLVNDTLERLYKFYESDIMSRYISSLYFMNGAFELLSRLVFRLNSEQKNKLFELIMNLFYCEPLRKIDNLHATFRNLVIRFLECMEPRELVNRLPDFVKLPIPGINGYHVKYQEHWPDPFFYLDLPEDVNARNIIDMTAIEPYVNSHIVFIKSDHQNARDRAILRIFILYINKLLSENQVKDFSRALWHNADSESQMPKMGMLKASAILYFKNFDDIDPINIFRKHVASLEFRNFSSGSVSIGGQDPLLEAINSGSRGLFDTEDWKIKWDQETLILIIRKFSMWWKNNRNILMPKKDNDNQWPTAFSEATNYLNDLLNVLARCIMPFLKAEDIMESDKEIMTSIYRDMDELHVNNLQIIPFSVLFEERSSTDIVSALKEGMASNSETKKRSALLGIIYWLAGKRHNNMLHDIGRAEKELIYADLYRIIKNNERLDDLTFKIISAYIRNYTDDVTDDDIHKITLTLELLKDNVYIPEFEAALKADNIIEQQQIENLQQLEAIAKLCNGLKYICHIKGITEPTVLAHYKQIIDSIPLPEIKRAWART